MHTKTITLVLAGSLLAASAEASWTTPTLLGAQTPPAGQQGADRERTPVPASATAQAPRYVRASALAGAAVVTEPAGAAGRGESLGEIAAFHVALDTGAVTHAVVTQGGVAGIGADRRAVPFERLRWSAEERRFTTTLTRVEYDALPVLDGDEQSGAAAREGSGAGKSGTTAASMPRPARVLSTEKLSGQTIHLGDAADGETWGEIAGFAVALDGRTVAYAIVERGGIAGLGAAEHPVPWSALRMELVPKGGAKAGSEPVAAAPAEDAKEAKLRVSLAMPKEKLEQAPKIDADAGMTLESAEFRREVDGFYGASSRSEEPVGKSGTEREGTDRPRG